MSDESLPPLKKAFPRLREILGPQVMREIIEAAHGLKASRLCVLESRAARLVGALESCGLWVTLHDRKQLLFEDAGKGGWISGYGIETELEFPREGYLHLYAGRDPEAVLTAKKAEHSSATTKLAEFHAYPKCCA